MEAYENCYSNLYYIRWGANTDFETWSVNVSNPQPTAINPTVITNGYIGMNNTRLVMLTCTSSVMTFTANSSTSSGVW